jgi:hypothetical protein
VSHGSKKEPPGFYILQNSDELGKIMLQDVALFIINNNNKKWPQQTIETVFLLRIF